MTADAVANADGASPAGVVIDTNTVLDWLLFNDPGVAALSAAVTAGAVRWLVCARMRDEFARTLGYPALARWQPDSAQLLSQFARHAVMQPDPATLPAVRCSDADDQVFLDLAIATGARWLVSRDRAVLRLAKRAKPLGLCIVQPTRWTLHTVETPSG